jgi:hypothetical protein
LEAVPGKHSTDSLQKTAILGTSHIIRKVLQCVDFGGRRIIKRKIKRRTRKKRPVTRDDNDAAAAAADDDDSRDPTEWI